MFSQAAYFRLRRRDLRFAPGVAFLVALLALATFLNIYGDRVMRILRPVAVVAVLVCAGLALAGCGATGVLAALPSDEKVAVLKGAGEHIEKCDRRYWAKTGLPGSAGFEIDCKPSAQQQAEILAKAVQDAVEKALAATAAASPPASPK